MPYFTFTRLNLYLDLPPVIGFQHSKALWKAYNKSKQIAQFLQSNFTQIFAQMPLKGICTFSVFLEYTFRFQKFWKCFCRFDFEFAWSRAFKKCIMCCNLSNFFLHTFCFLSRFRNKYLDFCKFSIFSLDYRRRA